MERQASPFCPLEKFVSNGNNYDVNGMRNSSSSYSLSCRVCCWGGTVGHRVITTNDDVITWMASSTREFLHFVSANVQIIKRGWPHCAINESPFSRCTTPHPITFLLDPSDSNWFLLSRFSGHQSTHGQSIAPNGDDVQLLTSWLWRKRQTRAFTSFNRWFMSRTTTLTPSPSLHTCRR